MRRARLAAVVLLLLAAAPAVAEGFDEGLELALPEDVSREAHALLACLRRGDAPSAATSIERLVELRELHRIPDLTQVAAAFLARFDDAFEDSSPVVRSRLAEAAIGLAPDLPDLRLRLAGQRLREGFQGIGPAVTAALDGAKAYVRYPRGLLVGLSNSAFYVIVASVILVLSVSLMLLFRHASKLAHDVGDLFPAAPVAMFSVPEVSRSRRARFIVGSGLARMLGRMVLLLALILPVAAGIGLLASAAVWLLLVIAYARRAEVVASILVLLVIASVPVFGKLVFLPRAVREAPGPKVWSCIREHCGDAVVGAVGRYVLDRPGDTWARFALASRELQSGGGRPASLSTAEVHLEAADRDRAGAVDTLLGTVQVMRALSPCTDGKPDAALLARATRSFDAATKASATPEALVGLAITQGLAGDRAAMEKTLATVVSIVPADDLAFLARVRRLALPSEACAAPAALGRELRSPSVPDLAIYFYGIEPLGLPAAVPLRGVLVGRIDAAWLPLVAGGGVLLAIVLLAGRRRLHLAAACPRCGTVSCGHCNTMASGFDFCPVCLLEQVRPAFIDPLDLVALQQGRDRRKRRMRLLVPLLSTLVPGTGQILAGRSMRGLVMLAMAATALALVLLPVAPVVDGGAYRGGLGTGLPMLPPVLLVVVYFWSALDAWTKRTR